MLYIPASSRLQLFQTGRKLFFSLFQNNTYEKLCEFHDEFEQVLHKRFPFS